MGGAHKDMHTGRSRDHATCPYCHFALKPGNTVACPRCRAGHHPECWTDNEGCAIVGCGERSAPRAPVPPPPPVAAPAVHTHTGISVPLIVASVIAAISILGAGAAVVLTRDKHVAAEPVATAPAVTAPARPTPTGTVTVFEPSPDATRSQDGATPVAPGNAVAPATTAASAEPTDAAARGRLVIGSHYAFRIPAGWVTESTGIFHAATRPGENSYTESRWHAPDDASSFIHIDYTTGFHGDIGRAASEVRAGYIKGPDFREHSFGPVVLADGREVWRWRYSDHAVAERVEKRVEKVDYFLTACDTGYALLGVSPVTRYPQLAGLFADAVSSLHPRC